MKKNKTDYLLLAYFGILLAFGLIMLTSASSPVGHERFGDAYFFIKRQLLFGVLPGIIFFIILAKLDYHLLKKYALPIFVGTITLLLLVFIPGIGSNYNTSSSSWLSVAGFSFQPAELAKLALIVYTAGMLAKMGGHIKDLKQGFLLALGVGFIPIILVILQPDIGTVSILFSILFAMLFVAGARWSHILGLAGAGLSGLVLMIVMAPYRAARLMTFLHPELDPQGIGYHINQAFLAIGSGGILGRGLGHSLQKYQYLPEVHSDSIYAIIAEEMGLLFALAIVILLILIIARGFMVAKHAPDQFGRLLVSGIIIWFATQSFLNIGAIVGILPLTGVPLPFISHGGTALMIAMGAVGIVVNVSKQT
jgi:cell division protein FtsW